jgi:RHS repeat-associated protein
VRGTPLAQTNLNFTGQRRDDVTGLLYYHARYYDPVLGRFLSADTQAPEVSNPQDLNIYSYVHNNPVRYTDPTGHCIPGIGDCQPIWAIGQEPNAHDFAQYSAGVVEGMGSLGATVASLAMPETWQTAARGLESFIADPGAAATTVGQAVIDQGKSIMATAADVASDPAGECTGRGCSLPLPARSSTHGQKKLAATTHAARRLLAPKAIRGIPIDIGGVSLFTLSAILLYTASISCSDEVNRPNLRRAGDAWRAERPMPADRFAVSTTDCTRAGIE